MEDDFEKDGVVTDDCILSAMSWLSSTLIIVISCTPLLLAPSSSKTSVDVAVAMGDDIIAVVVAGAIVVPVVVPVATVSSLSYTEANKTLPNSNSCLIELPPILPVAVSLR